MKIIEERKALEEGFDRLQRIYREWQRNPSALVRDSLKKYLIECYDHLLRLDRIDIDAGKFEDSITSDMKRGIIDERDVDEIKTVKPEPAIKIVQDDKEPIINLDDKIEDKVEAKIEEKVEEGKKESVKEDKVKEEEIIAKVEEAKDKPNTKEEPKLPVGKDKVVKAEDKSASEVYLSGDEEREIEAYFKSNFPESKVDEMQSKMDAESNEGETVAEVSEEIKSEKVKDKNTKDKEVEVIESKEEAGTDTNESDALKKEEIESDIVLEEKSGEEAEEDIIDQPKNRWSSFFSKDEQKPFESGQPEQQQLTLADKLTTKKEAGLHYEMKELAIADLNSAIPIAKKFEFIRELFADDSTNYKTAVTSINDAKGLQMALDITENLAETYSWANKEKLSDEFRTFVKRRFN